MSTYFVTINGSEHTIRFGTDGGIDVDGTPYPSDIRMLDAHTYSLLHGNQSVKVNIARQGDELQCLVNGKQLEVQIETERDRLIKKFDRQQAGTTHRAEIKAPMPALVVKLEVAVGDEVTPGQGLVILEAMKMENEIKAHSAGTVKKIYVEKGRAVEKGELLMLLE